MYTQSEYMMEECALGESQTNHDDFQQPKLQWKECASLPWAIAKAQVLQSGCHIYVGGGETEDDKSARKVLVYHVGEDQWRELPVSPCSKFGLALIKNCIVTVGGVSVLKGNSTNALYNFNNELNKWCRQYPDMNESRLWCSCASSERYVVVVGGTFEDRNSALDTVEVLDVDRLVWNNVARLPTPEMHATCVLHDATDTIYVAGGCRSSVWRCGVKALIESREKTPVWTKITDMPLVYGGCAYHQDKLFIAGGVDGNITATSDVLCFDLEKGKWAVAGGIPAPRTHCSLAMITHSSHVNLLLLGGLNHLGILGNDVLEAVNIAVN